MIVDRVMSQIYQSSKRELLGSLQAGSQIPSLSYLSTPL